MTGPPHPAPAALALHLDKTLVEVKIAIPPLRPGLISRSRTIDEARASERPVVAISAPAGYGKSSLLAQWAADEERAVAWVSLDRFDDDPVALLTLLAAAFAKATGADPSLIADMRVHSGAVLGRAAPHLAAALRFESRPFVFLVDDLHLLTAPACHDVLGVVLAGVPDGSQFVAASRTAQPHVPSMRAADGVAEIGAEQLALDAAGALHIFEQARVQLSAELAEAVIIRTEGWPVGLHLAAAIARVTGDPGTVINGSDRYVADYLYNESFANLSGDIQRFLRRTAILEHLSDGLCRAIVGEDIDGAGLRELERSNLFLVAEDRTRDWYHYHPLYREFLMDVLRRDEPGRVAELHERAAAWYEARGSAGIAVEHLLQSSNREHCAVLVDALGLRTYQSGDLVTLERWLSAIGDAAIEQYPPLAVLSGWVSVLSGHAAEADRWAARLETTSFDGVPADGSASFASSRAMLRAAMCPDGTERMMEDAQYAASAEPHWSPWRDLAVSLVGEAHLLAGSIDDAVAAFTECAALDAPARNTDVQIRSETQLALIDMPKGHWTLAGERLDIALGLIAANRIDDYATAVPTFAAAARLALHHGDLKRAERELTRAMRARPMCTYAMPYVSVRVRIQLVQSFWQLGDSATARHLMHEIEDLLHHRPRLGVLVEQYEQLKHVVAEATRSAPGGPPLTPAELRLLPYLQTHLSIAEIGARLFVSRNTVSTELGSIYRKLGVSSRGAAVDAATAAGMLGA